eukprot:TRINITY_DN4554_c0_g1_i1.p1 TRINITY_DN4554_c0_g1~~TRINITY_DN4554_c0_g1_i1.p1  ORF type:complete len:117 (-),score=16.67 TRINITY_DN4554_c0_g1_i1:400-750(-)
MCIRDRRRVHGNKMKAAILAYKLLQVNPFNPNETITDHNESLNNLSIQEAVPEKIKNFIPFSNKGLTILADLHKKGAPFIHARQQSTTVVALLVLGRDRRIEYERPEEFAYEEREL